MEIEIFNASLTRRRVSMVPTISFYKSGQFVFNVRSVDALNLQKGVTISFAKDKKNPKDWYILRDPEGVNLSQYKTELKGSHKTVRTELNKLFPAYEGKTIRFKVATEPTQNNGHMMYAILTSKPL